MCMYDIFYCSYYQVLSAIKYLDTNSLNYHCLTCDNVLLWLLEPVTIKLSDSGLLHSPANCIVSDDVI